MSSAFLSVQGLSKTWGGVQVVQPLSFDVAQGEFVALLGPSGCGKSTTLKMIAGLEQPTSGDIFIQNQNVTHSVPSARNLSMVFQSYALFPHLSVKENILFGLKARKVNKAEQIKRLNHAVELVSLGDQLNKKPSELSGGQCQRVALARSIVSQAPLCLMDEPLSNLDAKLRNDMRSELRALQKRLGLTVLYVTHDQIEAMSMADTVILLNQGHIEQMGAPNELYNQPSSQFVGAFIGAPAMNFIGVDEITVGVRPEHIQIEPLDAGEDTRSLTVTVKHHEYHGANTLVEVELGVQSLRFNVAGLQYFETGTAIHLNWHKANEHYFSTSSGERLAGDFSKHAVSF